jgi:threonine dehydrogenase-like Zn-dependent dehydrogenase
VNFDEVDVRSVLLELTGGRGPDKCIDAVGMEGGHGSPHIYYYDRVKQLMRSESDRPYALRQAILSCRNGGIVSVVGVYGGMIDKFPSGSWINRGLTLRAAQTPVHRYLRPLLERIERKEIDPTRIITHTLPLDQAAHGYHIFKHKLENCEKVVLKP